MGKDGNYRPDNPGGGLFAFLMGSLAIWMIIVLLTAWSTGYKP